MNGHINNVTYLGWALETVPPQIADSCTLHQVWPRLLSVAFVVHWPSRARHTAEIAHATRLQGRPGACMQGSHSSPVRRLRTGGPQHAADQAA